MTENKQKEKNIENQKTKAKNPDLHGALRENLQRRKNAPKL